MPYSNKLLNWAKTQKEPLPNALLRLLNEHGSIRNVAVHLGVYDNAVRHWTVRYGIRKDDGGVWTLESSGQVQ